MCRNHPALRGDTARSVTGVFQKLFRGKTGHPRSDELDPAGWASCSGARPADPVETLEQTVADATRTSPTMANRGRGVRFAMLCYYRGSAYGVKPAAVDASGK